MRHSVSEYPANWPEIAKVIKDAAGWKCVRCNHHHEVKTGYVLTVHHLDLDPQNCEWWNCPALCQRCHLKIQAKVFMDQPYMLEHTEWFKPYVAGYYAFKNGHPTDWEWVMANLEMLLDYGRPAPSPLSANNGLLANADPMKGER